MMKALQIFILFAIISGALAIADVDEITALLNIRNHVRPLDERWPEEAVRHACDPNWYLHFITCTGDHVTEMYVIWSTCLYISSFMSTCSCIPPNHNPNPIPPSKRLYSIFLSSCSDCTSWQHFWFALLKVTVRKVSVVFFFGLFVSFSLIIIIREQFRPCVRGSLLHVYEPINSLRSKLELRSSHHKKID